MEWRGMMAVGVVVESVSAKSWGENQGEGR